MKVQSLQIQNFRNIQAQTLLFAPGVNILLGDNAQGKTNILEALWLFSATKSFRVSDEKPFLRFGEERAALYAEYESDGHFYRPAIKFAEGKRRQLFLNNLAIRPGELVGRFPAVLFYPDHLSLVKGSPELRRKFLDFALCQVNPRDLPLLNQYNRVLQQRNALLRHHRQRLDWKDSLDLWDRQIAKLSAGVAVERANYLADITPYAQKVMNEISNCTEILSLSYQTVCDTAMLALGFDRVEDRFLYALQQTREKDLAIGYTSTGVHRDDFELQINGKNTKIYASQGQQRSCVMALKLGEADRLREETGEYPMMLFDDVFSELDKNRKQYIIERIRDRQVILSCCDTEGTEEFGGAKVFTVKNGEVF